MADTIPQFGINFPPAPERVRRDGGSTSYGALDPRQVAAGEDLDRLTDDKIALEAQRLEQAKRTRQIETERANDEAKTAETHAAAREKVLESTAADIAAARDRLRAKQDEYDKMTPASLFGGQGTAGQIAMSIGLAMGAYSDAVKASAAIRLQRDAGASTVDGIIKNSFDRQRENAARVKDSVAMARTGIQDANEARAELLADIDLKEASAYKVAERMTKARLASQGMSAEQIASDANVVALNEKRKEAQLKRLEPLTQKIETNWSSTVNTGGAAPAQHAPVVLTVPGYGTAPDEITRRKMSDKAAAFDKFQSLTKRLTASNPEAPLGSAERTQITNDLKEATVSLAILNNNDGKPSDGDMRAAEKQVGGITLMGTRAAAARRLGKPGLDPRETWRQLGARSVEKFEADLRSNLGQGLDPTAIDRIRGGGRASIEPPPTPMPQSKARDASDDEIEAIIKRGK